MNHAMAGNENSDANEQERAESKQPSTKASIGIGASAGGVQALQTFFEALPDRTGVAFVVIVHLAPESDAAKPQADSGLDYERESYLIVRALHEHLGVVVNEMGELDDLVDGLRCEPPPLGVHFSGHGGRGTLLFEDAYGEGRTVTVDELLTAIRRHAPEQLPRFFFLACCHGGDAPEQGGALAATVTALHADRITQVVGYFGPVRDELSTRAERAFYAELAQGRRTRDAVRAARREMSTAPLAAARGVLRDAGAAEPGGAFAHGWAQMVLYQRGPDYPLGTAIAADASVAIETTERRLFEAYPGSRSRVLKTGFVGRRREMHALRRDLRGGQQLHVLQGTGGLGKSDFCNEALKLYSGSAGSRWRCGAPTSKAPPTDSGSAAATPGRRPTAHRRGRRGQPADGARPTRRPAGGAAIAAGPCTVAAAGAARRGVAAGGLPG